LAAFVFANVGVRDLQVKGLDALPARATGQLVLEQWDSYQAGLSAPILKPVLDYVFKRYDPRTCINLVLFATNQAEGTDERYRNQDTVYCASVLQRYLAGLFPDRLHITIRHIPQGLNPARMDDMYSAYGRLVRKNDIAADDDVYVSLSGGTPACNAALMLQSIQTFGDRCQAIYKPQHGDAVGMRIGRQVARATIENLIAERLKVRDFAAATRHLSSLDPADSYATARALASYAAHRLSFDFRRAALDLDRIQQDRPDLRSFVASALSDLTQLEQGTDQAPLLAELHANTTITWRQDRYVDVLARIFRFEEAVLRLLLERALPGFPTGDRPADRRRRKEIIEADPGLHHFLENYRLDGNPLRYCEGNRPAFAAILTYITKPDSRRPDGSCYAPPEELDRYRTAAEILDSWASLKNWRNDSIMGHGFRGASVEDFRQAGVPNPPDDMGRILGCLKIPSCSLAHLDQVAALITQELRRAG